jgi:hypothetical protein
LQTAVAVLIDPIKAMTLDGVQTAPSLYDQLIDDIPAAMGDGGPGPYVWASLAQRGV